MLSHSTGRHFPAFTMRDFYRIAKVSNIDVIITSTPVSYAALTSVGRIIVLSDRLEARELTRTARKLLTHSFGN